MYIIIFRDYVTCARAIVLVVVVLVVVVLVRMSVGALLLLAKTSTARMTARHGKPF